jgi:hypothetical protein
MMATFKIEEHHVRGGGAAVCVFDDDGEFVATVVWRDHNIVVISKYIEAVQHDARFPPAAVITLKERSK